MALSKVGGSAYILSTKGDLATPGQSSASTDSPLVSQNGFSATLRWRAASRRRWQELGSNILVVCTGLTSDGLPEAPSSILYATDIFGVLGLSGSRGPKGRAAQMAALGSDSAHSKPADCSLSVAKGTYIYRVYVLSTKSKKIHF